MTDTKISALPAVTLPASTDEFAVNQGGTSKKMTRAQVHKLQSGEVLLLDKDGTNAAPALAFVDEINLGFYRNSAASISIGIAGAQRWQFNATVLASGSSFGGAIQIGNSGVAAPTLLPNKIDSNTGIGGTADNLALIAGGIEGVRVEDPADLAATETSLWLYDDDTGAIVQVTVGANDSGGAGFKVLRIAN